ncbi:MAG: hypothetical protein ACSLEW_08900, partial [Nocardioides sp.]
MERAFGLIVMAVAGLLSLPISATVLDQAGPDGLILPAQLVGMAGFGALVSWQIPGVVGEARSVGRRAWVGATLGVGFALLGV